MTGSSPKILQEDLKYCIKPSK